MKKVYLISFTAIIIIGLLVSFAPTPLTYSGKEGGTHRILGELSVNGNISAPNKVALKNPSYFFKERRSSPSIPFHEGESTSTYDSGLLRVGEDTIWCYTKGDNTSIVGASYSVDNGENFVHAGVCIPRNTGSDDVNQVAGCRPYYNPSVSDTIHFLYKGYSSSVDSGKIRIFYGSTTRSNPDTALYHIDGNSPIILPDSVEAWTGYSTVFNISVTDILFYKDAFYITMAVWDFNNNDYAIILLKNEDHLSNGSAYRYITTIMAPEPPFDHVAGACLYLEDSTWYAFVGLAKETISGVIVTKFANNIEGPYYNNSGVFMAPNKTDTSNWDFSRIYTPYLLKNPYTGNVKPDTVGGYWKLAYSGSSNTVADNRKDRSAIAKVYSNRYQIEDSFAYFPSINIPNHWQAPQHFWQTLILHGLSQNTNGDGIYPIGVNSVSNSLQRLTDAPARLMMGFGPLLDADSTAIGDNIGRAYIKSGTGSPEGVEYGEPGWLYVNKSGGAGTTFYVKESGNNKINWAAK